jgi:hypothetical protein
MAPPPPPPVERDYYGGYSSGPPPPAPEKDHSGRNIALGVVGGLAVGAVGGALLEEAFGTYYNDEMSSVSVC